MSHSVNFEDNNEFFKVLFQNLEEGLIVTDMEAVMVFANNRAQEMFGYHYNELIGNNVEMLIPTRYHSTHVKDRNQYMKKPVKKRMGTGRILEAKTKFGNSFYAEISLNYVDINQKKYIVTLIIDVTKQREAELKIKELNAELEDKVKQRTMELEESQFLYTAVARNFPNGTINVFDRDLNYIFAEGRELYKYGITSKKLIGTSYLNRLAEDIRPQINEELQKVLNGQIRDFELQHKNQYYHINAVPLRNELFEIDKILLVETNVTPQKVVSQKLEQSLQKEKEINEMKSRFVSMASHEFRTPLSTILSSTSLIQKYIEKEQYESTEKHINRIKNSVKGLTEILNDFLSSDKLESKKINVNPCLFNYTKWVLEMTEELQTICKEGQTIKPVIKSINEDIIADANILKNIIYNLLSNAIKYSGENQDIEFISEITDNELSIQVKDYGIGIPKVEQNNIFNRFFRAQNATNIKGTGLGLNIVKSYIDLLDGNITFESEEYKGTTFSLKIPISNEQNCTD